MDDTADEADRRERRADALAEAWQNELARARGLLDEAGELSRPVEAELLGDALGAAIGLVPGMQGSSNPHGPLVGLTVQADGERVRVAMVARSHPRSVLALLDAIIRVTEHARVLVVRERAHELRPTWRACLQRRERLVGSANASWLDLERDDVTKLLALQGLLSNARSRDLTDAEGRPLPFEVVRKWAQSSLGVEGWAPIRAVRELAGRGGTAQDNGPPPGKKPVRNARADPSAVDDAPMPSAAPRDLVGASAGGADGLASMDTGPKGSAIGVLRQLRVASLERLVRESARIHGACSRHDVLTELDGAGERVQWFGRSIVAIREEP